MVSMIPFNHNIGIDYTQAVIEEMDRLFQTNSYSEKELIDIFGDSIYHSIKNRRIDIFEKLTTLKMFSKGYHAKLIYSDFLKRIIKNDDGSFYQTISQELLMCACKYSCFHLCDWLLSKDNLCVKFSPFDKYYMLDQLSSSSLPVFKDYMINKINNQQISNK
ncbi:hypothetical protein ACTFIZ_011252 [Dictyostelium cf. discoideum]